MKNSLVTKTLSITLSATLLATSFTGIASAVVAPAAAAMPDFVRALTPPENLGFVDSYYQGNTQKPVILIEDLHANYGVQKKILGMLQRFQSKAVPQGKPMVLGMEGAWGKIDLTSIRKKDKKAKDAVADFLMKEAEIGAPEHFATTSAAPVQLVGIDNATDYYLNRDLFRKSAAARLRLAYKVELMQTVVNASKGDAARSIRKIWKIEDDFRNGKIDLVELAHQLDVPVIANYGEAESFLYQKKMALADKAGAKSQYFKNLIRANQELGLLSRLLRQQMTLEEVQFVSKHVSEILVIVAALMPREDLREWRETINAAIDFYAVALLRDKPLSEHAYELAQQNPDNSVVVVTGGFHTAAIADYLKQNGVSYMVLAPVVESNTTRDEILYLQRMLGNHVTADEITKGVSSQRASYSSVQDGAIARAFETSSGHPNELIDRNQGLDTLGRAFDAAENPEPPTDGKKNNFNLLVAAKFVTKYAKAPMEKFEFTRDVFMNPSAHPPATDREKVARKLYAAGIGYNLDLSAANLPDGPFNLYVDPTLDTYAKNPAGSRDIYIHPSLLDDEELAPVAVYAIGDDVRHVMTGRPDKIITPESVLLAAHQPGGVAGLLDAVKTFVGSEDHPVVQSIQQNQEKLADAGRVRDRSVQAVANAFLANAQPAAEGALGAAKPEQSKGGFFKAINQGSMMLASLMRPISKGETREDAARRHALEAAVAAVDGAA